MTTAFAITTRPYQGPADLPAIIELALAHKAAAACSDRPSIAGLRGQLTAPDLDPGATRLWIAANGALVAFAVLGSANHLVAFIHPGERAAGGRWGALMGDALAWGLAQASVRARRLGAPVTLTTDGASEDMAQRAQLVVAGFACGADEAIWLARSLDDALASAQLPAGYRLRAARDDVADVAAYVALFNEAFATGPAHRMTVARRRALMADDAYIPELDLVAEAADGSRAPS